MPGNRHSQASRDKAFKLHSQGLSALAISKKIENRKFKTFQEADRLIKVESDLIIRVGTLLQMDLFNRSRRYIDDPWDW